MEEKKARSLKEAIDCEIVVIEHEVRVNEYGAEVLTIVTDDNEEFATTSNAFRKTLLAGLMNGHNRFKVEQRKSKNGFNYLVAVPVTI